MWKFEQVSGKLFDPNGVLAGLGYAGGDTGKRLDGVNNPALQSIKDVGPLPCGLYTFQTPILESHLGKFAIPLIPDSTNIMYNRGNFFVHGDLISGSPHSASEGCIILPRPTRNAMWASPDHLLLVY
jgi:hypothetical protein